MKFAKEILGRIPVPGAAAKKLSWLHLGLLTVASVYFYVFMEWLFFVTKPSFMDVMGVAKKVEVLFSTSFFLIVLTTPPVAILFALTHIPWLKRGWVWFLYMGALIPSGIFTATSLLLVDNFTYTIFRWGVVTSQGAFRALYGVLFVLAFYLWYRWVILTLQSKRASLQLDRSMKAKSLASAGVIVVSMALALPQIDLTSRQNSGTGMGSTTQRPHILLLGGDGLNADNMSVYGYDRDTTPNLRIFARSSLVAENAFTNSGNSPGSIMSILTGKHPLSTRVLYPPDILQDSDSYQHLPGILRGLGYRNIQIGISHYIDVYNMNMRDGFDLVNKRSQDQVGFQLLTQRTGLQSSGYFISALTERLSDRVQHIFLLQEMTNPYQEVTDPQPNATDEQRINQLLKHFREAEQPLFVHVHLMGTHGPLFGFRKELFSAGKTQDAEWMTDFYDDSILEFDGYIYKVWSELEKSGLLEETIVIIYSDHAQQWGVDQEIPLIIRFPGGEYAGRIESNVQNLDIAPTVLDYMGLAVPEWMEGESLLAGEPDPTRPILTTGIFDKAVNVEGNFYLDVDRMEPPFYQFGFLRMYVCQNWYQVNFDDIVWREGELSQHTARCEDPSLPGTQAAQEELLQRLEGYGFDTVSLKTYFSSHTSE